MTSSSQPLGQELVAIVKTKYLMPSSLFHEDVNDNMEPRKEFYEPWLLIPPVQVLEYWKKISLSGLTASF